MRLQIRRPVPLTFHGHRRTVLRGEVVTVADEIGERLLAQGWANPVDEDAEPTPERIDPSYDDMTVEQLQALADERALEVEGTGTDGRVLKADLVAALTVE